MEYRPNRPEYWDETLLRQDLEQAFDICNGCRLCYNLCPSFPVLFEAVERHQDNAHEVTDQEMVQVADLCYQCKLCFMKCPYVPPHRFDLDFPRLMLRSKAVRAKKAGIGRADQFLGNPEKVGQLGHLAPGLANWSTRNPVLRRWMERVYGIDHRRHLPRFAAMRFSEWVKRRQPVPNVDQVDVVIFSTCTVEFHEPGIGQAALAVLQHNHIRAAVPSGQLCCGMPALDGGDIAGAMRRARHNIALLAPYAEAGKPILALQPTCALLLKQDYPRLVEEPAAQKVAAMTQDITEYLADAMRKGKLKKEFAHPLGSVTYHLSCHTKAQGLKRAVKDLLGPVADTQVELVDRCAGIDGTWGLKAQYYDDAMKVSAKLTEKFREAHDSRACSDCALAGLQIETVSDQPPRHPVELLAQAYGIQLKG